MTQASILSAFLLVCALGAPLAMAEDGAEVVDTEYQPHKAVIEFYFEDPRHINGALFWLRSLINTANAEPYGYSPDEHDIKVVIHGTEIVTLAQKNYDRYKEAVERMRYYSEFGVEFKVCGQAAHDFDYTPEDFHDFVQVIPSAMNEIIHWQEQGYGLLIPRVLTKRFSTEEIR
ncbi:MAG: DsrE family protein [Gammaproteobacteria bacterium]